MHRRAPTFRDLHEVAFRVTSYDMTLWVNANRRPGRWNVAGDFPTQYMALDAEAPFADVLRHEDLRTEEEASHYSATLWQLRIETSAIVDYSSFELAEAAGFAAEALVDDDFSRCQVEAKSLREQGARGVLSPSAALPRSLNLTLFGARVEIPWNARVELASSVPAQRLATGHPPAGLTARVRYFGQRHALLDAYRPPVSGGRGDKREE